MCKPETAFLIKRCCKTSFWIIKKVWAEVLSREIGSRTMKIQEAVYT